MKRYMYIFVAAAGLILARDAATLAIGSIKPDSSRTAVEEPGTPGMLGWSR